MYTEMERNSKRRECMMRRLVWATAPLGEGTDVGIRGARAEGAGRAWALGSGTDVGVGDAGTGTFAAATAVTRRCARLRSVLRWLIRRLEAPVRRDGRVVGAVVVGTQSRYTSIVAKK